MKNKTGFFCFTYLDLKRTNLFGQDRKRIMISMVNQALQTHSTKKNASWALVWYLSNVQAVELKEVRTVIFLITGTRISGWVLRQKETIDTTIKNTEMIPITWNVLRKKLFWLFLLRIGIYYLSTYVAKVSREAYVLNKSLRSLFRNIIFCVCRKSERKLPRSKQPWKRPWMQPRKLFDHAS